jgi:hypothetical protein
MEQELLTLPEHPSLDVMLDLSRHRSFAIIAFVEDTEHIRFNQMMTQ